MGLVPEYFMLKTLCIIQKIRHLSDQMYSLKNLCSHSWLSLKTSHRNDMRNGYKLGPEFNDKVRLNKGQLSMLKIVDVQCLRMV